MTAAITLRHVGKTYPDGTRAVSGLDLHVDAGELMVIVSPSAAARRRSCG